MTAISPSIIDMREQVAAIHKEYGKQIYHNPEALEKLAGLWGFQSNNRHGVLTDYSTESLVQIKLFRGDVYFAESTKGHWLIGINACTSSGGYCYAPSVFHETGFASYQDARLAGILKLEDFFQRELASTSLSHAGKEIARSALRILEQEKQPKLDLFGSPQTGGGVHDR